MSGLEETRVLTGDTSQRGSLHHVDVTDRERMSEFATEVMRIHGRVDLLINNAGVSLTPMCFEETPDEQFDKVMDINMWGVYNGIRVFLPHLRTRPEASIVNMSSLAGRVGLYGYSAYSMSKFAVRGLSEALQSELAGSGVNVLIVHPGGVKTNIIKNAPNLAESQREAAHASFNRSALLDPDDAAAKILRSVQKKKTRLILGIDARLVYTIRNLFPRAFPKIIQAIFSRAMFRGEDARPDS
jgi:NAD(P)-dependent dehydrogenase (short-subunit alcohol dehydrogenase family)